jgi:hypothetical protein
MTEFTKINVTLRLWRLEDRNICVTNTNEILAIALLRRKEVPIELIKIIESFYGKMGFLDHVVIPYLKESLFTLITKSYRSCNKLPPIPESFMIDIKVNKSELSKLYQMYMFIDNTTPEIGYLKIQIETKLLKEMFKNIKYYS